MIIMDKVMPFTILDFTLCKALKNNILRINKYVIYN